MEEGPWKISIKYGRASGRAELIDTGQYLIRYQDTFVGYYERQSGMPVFIVRRPRLLTEAEQGDLAHLVRAIDEQAGYSAPRELVFIKGIQDSLPTRRTTPEKSRIVLPE
jgi:hypothetical protein